MTDDSKARSILKLLVDQAQWYGSAIELDNHGPDAIDGCELFKEAKEALGVVKRVVGDD